MVIIKKLAVYNLERTVTRAQPCWHRDLTPPAFRTVTDKFLLFISLYIYGYHMLFASFFFLYPLCI